MQNNSFDLFSLVKAAGLSIMLCSFSDWYFYGILFHRRYSLTPGVWKKYSDKKDEMKSVTIAMIFQSLTSLIFILVSSYLGLTSLHSAVGFAVAIWLMVPMPLLLANSVFIPMDKMIVLAHGLGWLARLMITALCVAWLH